MLKKRIQNQCGYQKRKTKGKRQTTHADKNLLIRQTTHEDKEFTNDELEGLNALLLKETKAKKPNKQAIIEMQEAPFTSRSKYSEKLATDKTVLSEISSSYPSFAIHEYTVRLKCKINSSCNFNLLSTGVLN